MHSRRAFLGGASAGLLAGRAPAQVSPAKRNILLLIADDLGLHTGEYGDRTAVTPNLDALARDGVRFTRAFCTTASCSASRSVLYSGLHNHANGQYGHAHDFHGFSYLPHVRPLSSLLKDAGYRTGIVGKLHVNPVERFRWDLHSEGGQRDVLGMAERARRFIAESGSRPWFLTLGYADPHRAERGFANREYRGVRANRFDPAKVPVPAFLPDNQATRGELAEYYEAANRLDQGVGFVLDALRQTGELDRTLVLFLSDNGMPFPNAKTGLYEGGMRLPLIVRAPGQAKRGLVNRAMVSWSDITPALLEWSGAKGPGYPLHGRSFLPVLEQESPPDWDRVYMSHTFHEITMYYPMRGVRTRRYKYIRNLFSELQFPFSTDLFASATWQSVRNGGNLGRRPVEQYLHRAPEELYDLERDPEELNNLARSESHRKTLEELRRDVQAFRKRTQDGWLVNDEYK